MRFSLFTPKKIARGLKRIRESKMGTPYSTRIIQDADLTLKAFWVIVTDEILKDSHIATRTESM